MKTAWVTAKDGVKSTSAQVSTPDRHSAQDKDKGASTVKPERDLESFYGDVQYALTPEARQLRNTSLVLSKKVLMGESITQAKC